MVIKQGLSNLKNDIVTLIGWLNFLPANTTKSAIHEPNRASLTPSSIKPVCITNKPHPKGQCTGSKAIKRFYVTAQNIMINEQLIANYHLKDPENFSAKT